jgi:two-component system OmpR family response regulator
MRILIVEDDDQMGAIIERGLAAEGYDVVRVTNGIDALIAAAHAEFDLAAIDVMLPQMSGFEICRRVRETGSTMPVLLLTARDTVEDRVYGLDSGADDYLTKPFAFAELKARVRALLRRQSMGTPLSIELGRLMLDSRRNFRC